ncbi:MAG: DUF5045 domain-containing protein [Flavobacteriaceae bacterium]|nr:DUF5045 domain-containing protein [Flavobacteriaceae bacterium]
MVKKLIILLVLLGGSCSVFGQRPAHDEAKMRQIESMAFKKWSKSYFKPKWYYWLFHNQYRSGSDKRYIWQLSSIYETSELEEKEAKKAKKEVKKRFDYAVVDALDRKLNPKYNLFYKDEVNESFQNLEKKGILFQTELMKNKVPNKFKIIAEHLLIIDDFKNRLKVIKKSYRPSAEKNENLDKLLDEIKKYIGFLDFNTKRMKAFTRYNKYFNNSNIKL